MIIDCHTHWGIQWEERTPGDPTEWMRFLDRHGIDRAFFMPTAGLFRSDRCSADNNNIARMAARWKRLIPVGTAWPSEGKQAVEEVRRSFEKLGMRGLKLHPWVQGFSTAGPVMGDLCQLAAEAKAPILFHDGTPPYSLAEQIAGLARRFPRTRLVLLHSGLLWNWRSALNASRLPNVWLALCGPHRRALEILAAHGPPDRLIWGSDFGFGLADQIEYRLNLLRRARIDDKLRERILGENALRLLNET
ncbi:MAG: amidohydrolase family protein [Bryobacteraceae bacterium]